MHNTLLKEEDSDGTPRIYIRIYI